MKPSKKDAPAGTDGAAKTGKKPAIMAYPDEREAGENQFDDLALVI